MSLSMQAAAFHGLATNLALAPRERFRLALQALDLYKAELERLQGVAEAARAFRRAAELTIVDAQHAHEVEVQLDEATDALFAALDVADAHRGAQP